jgi:hypothetical protein
MSGHSYDRRSVLRGAAGVGALGLAAAAGAGSVVAASTPAAAATTANPAPARGDTPVVVYLRDASSGELEIFAGTSQARIHDAALAARLAGAIGVR